MRTQPRCKRCGEPITFLLRGGFVRRGEPRHYPVNLDDKLPHWRRCKINQDLQAAKNPKPQRPTPTPPQTEMFK